MGDAYVALDRDWRITYVNPAAARLNGITAVEAVGKTHAEQWPASAGTELERMYRRALDERIAIHMEHRYVEAGKFDTWFEIDACPTDDGGLGIFFRDISARKRAQEALEEGERQFRMLAESIPQLAWMADANGYIYWYNQRWYDYTGTTAEDMAGWGWQSVHDPDQLPLVLDRWQDSIRTGEAFDMEFPLKGADGVFRWFITRVVPVSDACGNVVQWFGTNTDVNERRRMEAKFRATFEQASVGICHTASNGTWLDLNERFCQIVGYSRDELRGMTFRAITHPDDVRRDEDAVARLVAGDLRSYRTEKRYIRKDGSTVWTELTSSFVHDDGSYAAGAGYLVTVVEDISERKAAEQRLNEANLALEELNAELEMRAEQLQETATELEAQTEELQVTTEELMQKTEEAQTANQTKSDFLASMSHELRTPLNAIGGYVELIEMGLRGPVTPEQLTDLARIQRSQKHLLSLINDVLNFAKLGAGQVEYDTENVTLDTALRDTEEMVLPQMRAKDIGYTYEGCDPTLAVSADREKLQQIMLNLLSNAVKFTHPGGHISVACQVSDTFISIRVSDTGIGIPADKLDSIFQPFVQVERKLSQPTTGAGLGLAISHDLALGMGGDLMVESAGGGGSTFTLMMPRATD
ncbi:MAG: PAS domain S-box protein [Gemmatimonadaceae bacterium]